MADIPDTLTLKHNRDLVGAPSLWWRRGIVLALAAFAAAGLANVFGQRPGTTSATSPEAKLSLYAPSAMRGGDFMEARFHITALQDVKDAILKLDPGWAEGLSVNEIEPSPLNQGSDDGRLTFTLGHIPKGKSFILFMQFQVNPTNVAWRRRQDVELDDGAKQLFVIHRRFTVFP